jgi:hypothetical protein
MHIEIGNNLAFALMVVGIALAIALGRRRKG